MPRKALKASHIGIRMNSKSAQMEARLAKALDSTAKTVKEQTGLTIEREKTLYLQTIVDTMNEGVGATQGLTFARAYKKSNKTHLKPDGGFWYVKEWGDPKRWILIAEAKRQGTNDERKRQGKEKQSLGNAIERMGKNMRLVDLLLLTEEITPFVGFAEGCDFAPDSYIVDRAAALNSFFPLNSIHVQKVPVIQGNKRLDTLKPISLFCRESPWTPAEMHEVLLRVALDAIAYYRKRYNLQ